MKGIYLLLCGCLLCALVVLQSCKKDEQSVTSPPVTQPTSATSTFNSTNGGSFSTQSGYGVTVVPGSVPRNSNGQSASITFSIETAVMPPKPVPSGATVKSDMSKFGPDGFFFRWPIRIKLKYPAGIGPGELAVLHYDRQTENWIAVPGSGANTTERFLAADVLDLGIYTLGQLTGARPKPAEGAYWGGFVYSNPDKYWYTLTVASVSNWKYAWQESWFGNSIVGRTGSTGTSVIGGPASETYILLPQASYQIWVSWTDGLGTFWTYSIPLEGTINNEVTYGIQETGWTPLGALTPGGQWTQGLPSSWPSPTVTYGTGTFQATLTWVNNASHTTDLDLHLYGPNGLHVYFGATRASDGSFELDRDWLSGTGNAIENIYSTGTIASGTYRVTVRHYSGSAASYGVRILRNATVNSYSGSITDGQEVEIASFTLP